MTDHFKENKLYDVEPAIQSNSTSSCKYQQGNCSDNDNNDNANQDKRKAKQSGPSFTKPR